MSLLLPQLALKQRFQISTKKINKNVIKSMLLSHIGSIALLHPGKSGKNSEISTESQ